MIKNISWTEPDWQKYCKMVVQLQKKTIEGDGKRKIKLRGRKMKKR